MLNVRCTHAMNCFLSLSLYDATLQHGYRWISLLKPATKTTLLDSGHLHSMVSDSFVLVIQENDIEWLKLGLFLSFYLFFPFSLKLSLLSRCHSGKINHNKQYFLKKKLFCLFRRFCCWQSEVLRKKVPQVTQHVLAGRCSLCLH